MPLTTISVMQFKKNLITAFLFFKLSFSCTKILINKLIEMYIKLKFFEIK